MTSAHRNRLARVEAKLRPPRAPEGLSAEELDAMSPEQLRARYTARFTAWENGPEGREFSRWLAGLSDQELLDVWNHKGGR